MTVSFNLGGTATVSYDYESELASGSVTIAMTVDGSNSYGAVEVPFTAIDDKIAEATETVEVLITCATTTPDAVVTIVPPNPAASAIGDNDALVVLISGHSQNGDNDGDGQTGPRDMSRDAGFRELEDQLKQAGFAADHILTFSEGPENDDDSWIPTALNNTKCHDNLDHIVGQVSTRIQNAKDANGQPFTLKIAIIGYSHGGGLAWKVSRDLHLVQKNPHQNFSIFFTGYADAIEAPLIDAENDLPPGTAYHVNYFQSEGDVAQDNPEGNNVDPGDLVPGQTFFEEDLDAEGNAEQHWGINGIDRDDHVHDEIVKHIKLARKRAG
jgi:hypothetical protein